MKNKRISFFDLVNKMSIDISDLTCSYFDILIKASIFGFDRQMFANSRYHMCHFCWRKLSAIVCYLFASVDRFS